MARFIIRNYGPSRQIPFKGKQICLSNDQAIETDDAEEADALRGQDNIYVNDRGAEFAAPALPEKPKPEKKGRKVTVDDANAVHAEKFPDEDEPQPVQPPAPVVSTEDKDEIAYSDMTVKELQVLAKDRTPPIKTSGLKKDELIKALEDYDRE